MDAEAVDAFCMALPGVTMDVLWGADQVYKVGGKMFAVMGPGGSLSFKASDIGFEVLTDGDAPGRPAPYMARAKWVAFERPGVVSAEDLKSYLQTAHALIAARLTRKARQTLGID